MYHPMLFLFFLGMFGIVFGMLIMSVKRKLSMSDSKKEDNEIEKELEKTALFLGTITGVIVGVFGGGCFLLLIKQMSAIIFLLGILVCVLMSAFGSCFWNLLMRKNE